MKPFNMVNRIITIDSTRPSTVVIDFARVGHYGLVLRKNPRRSVGRHSTSQAEGQPVASRVN
jgi:hypothetical protein